MLGFQDTAGLVRGQLNGARALSSDSFLDEMIVDLNE